MTASAASQDPSGSARAPWQGVELADALAHRRADTPPVDSFGGWRMWWSVNREDFLARGRDEAGVATDPGGGSSSSRPSPEVVARDVIPALLSALVDGDRDVRDAAAIAIGRCGDEREVAALTKALADRDRSVVDAAILGLGLIAQPSADKVLMKLPGSASSDRNRGLAALALGLSGGSAAREYLVKGLGTEKPASVESCRVLGLALWSGADRSGGNPERGPQVASVIQRALENPNVKDRTFQSIGTAALSKTRDPGSLALVLRALGDSRTDLKAAGAIAAGRVLRADDTKSVDVLIQALRSESHPIPARFMRISLGRIGGARATKELVKQFEGSELEQRAFAALGLGIARATEVAPRIREELKGALDEGLKGVFAISLGLMKDVESYPVIAAMAQGNINPELLAHCISYFALANTPEAIRSIQHALATSSTPEVQRCAADALGVMRAHATREPMAAILQTKGPTTARVAAAAGLGRLGDEGAVAPLLKVVAAREVPGPVRAAAVAALGVLAQRAARDPLCRVAIDSYYCLLVDPIDEIAARTGGIGRTTEAGGGKRDKGR